MMTKREQDDQYFDELEAEDALSLCDLPLNDHNWEDHHNLSTTITTSKKSATNNDLSELSDQDFFEFFSDFKSEMRAAEDIIFCGKLLPYRSPSKTSNDEKEDRLVQLDFKQKRFNPRSISDSSNDLQNSHSTAKNQFLKNIHSLDYRKLRRVSSSKSIKTVPEAKEYDQISGGKKCFGKNVCSIRSFSVPPSSSQLKTKKQLVMFGVMKSPAEMDLSDIRNRQNKRNPSSLFPGEETVSVKSNGGKSSWSIFRALGCKGHENVVVTASLRCISHV